jgi:hypothetical protein
MLCPRHDFYEKSPTQRHVDLASSSTRCTSPSCDMNFGLAWLGRVSRVFLCIMISLSDIHAARDNQTNKVIDIIKENI